MTQAQPNHVCHAFRSQVALYGVRGGARRRRDYQCRIVADRRVLLMWGLLFVFVFLSWRRQARVETRIAELEKAIAAGGGDGSGRQ
jgi:hypothetical protein